MATVTADNRKQLALAIASPGGAEGAALASIRQQYDKSLPLLSTRERTAVSLLLSSLDNSQQFVASLAKLIVLGDAAETFERNN